MDDSADQRVRRRGSCSTRAGQQQAHSSCLNDKHDHPQGFDPTKAGKAVFPTAASSASGRGSFHCAGSIS